VAYKQEISRKNRTCFLFVLDHSGSMNDPWSASASAKKADGVAEILNKTLRQLCLRCAKGAEPPRDYFDMGVIAYRDSNVESALGGKLKGQMLVPVNEFMRNPLRVVERKEAGGQTVKFPIWADPVCSGKTPMCQALKQVRDLIETWIRTPGHIDSYPPTVVHITDGEATDNDPATGSSPMKWAEEIRALSTKDGNVLLFNCHISSAAGAVALFPSGQEELADEWAQLLFSMSSVLPDNLVYEVRNEGLQVGPQPRGFGFNAGFEQLVKFLDIGTRGSSIGARTAST
jgi:hypothetical protein